MNQDRELRISQPNKSVVQQLEEYELQMVSTRGALLEAEGRILYNEGTFPNHNTRKGIPLVLGFSIDSEGNSHAATGLTVNREQILINFFFNYHCRVFYNTETPDGQ